MCQLDAPNYYLIPQISNNNNSTAVACNSNSLVNSFNTILFEMKQMMLFSVQFKHRDNHGLVLSKTGEVTKIQEKGAAYTNGIRVGDQIVILNGKLISEMSLKDVKKMLKFKTVRCLVRTRNIPMQSENILVWSKEFKEEENKMKSEETKSRSRNLRLMSLMEEHLESISLAPPPIIYKDTFNATLKHVNQGENKCVVPPPDSNLLLTAIYPPTNDNSNITNGDISDHIVILMNKTNAVSSMCRQLHVIGTDSDLASNSITSSENQEKVSEYSSNDHRTLTDSEKLDKVLQELASTEMIYVQDLSCLLNRFLIPLRGEKFLNTEIVQNLLCAVEGMLKFQTQFMEELIKPVDDKGEFIFVVEKSVLLKLFAYTIHIFIIRYNQCRILVNLNALTHHILHQQKFSRGPIRQIYNKHRLYPVCSRNS